MSRIFRGLCGLVGMVALLVGVPIALVRFVGRPWPRPLPSVDTIWKSIQAGDISDGTVVKALAVLIWIAWVRLAVSIVIEVAARVAGGQTPRITGLGSAQQWAAGLVAAVILLIGAAPRAAVASAASGPRPISRALLQTDPGRPAGGTATRFDVAPKATVADFARRPAPTPTTSAHVVRPYESFWSIAEDELGDGARWREIVDLNRGLEVAPGVTFDGTASRLLPGWVLLVPTKEANSSSVGPSTTSTPVDAAEFDADPKSAPEVHTVRVERGDTLSEIAEDQLGDAAAWPQLWDANRGRNFAGHVFDDPNLILTGWELVVPAVFAPPPVFDVPIPSVVSAPVVPAPDVPAPAVQIPAVEAPTAINSTAVGSVDSLPPSTAVKAIDSDGMPDAALPVPSELAQGLPVPVDIAPPLITAAGAGGEQPGRAGAEPTDERGVVWSLPGGLGAAVLLSSGVMAAVVSRRRRRMRGASVFARLADPSASAAATETVLRSLGEAEQIARLDIALRAAATELVTVAPGVGVIGAVVTADGCIDLLLTGAATAAPEPWVAVTEHCWRLIASTDLNQLADAARRANQPCPAIAHIGSTRVGDGAATGELFVDLEAVGLLTIEGDPVQASNVLRAIAAAVAVSPMSEIAHMIASGLPDVLLDHPLCIDAESLDVALDVAASAIGTTAATTGPTLSTFTLRARHQGGEAWEPAIVFAASADDEAVTDADLIALTGTAGRGLAVVVDRPVRGARWRLVQQTQHWVLQPLGLEVTPVGLTAEDLDRVRLLLDEADRPPLYDFELEPAISTEWIGTDWSLLVRLIGPVEVIDRDQVAVEFERSKALELVAWLSQHRDRSTRASARTALWEMNVRDATFANVVSDARRALARLVPTIDSDEWIGRTLTEKLPLHPGVTTDADQLEARLVHSRNQSAIDAIATLRPGLELVRDMPFSGTAYLWPDTEGITSQLTLLVTSAATVLAGHYLAIGDTDGVFWATGQGLKVLAGHEELIALRMRAHARHGDLAGVRQEWESYERALNADSWSDGDPAPKLVSLRRELLSSSMLQLEDVHAAATG